MIFFLLFKFYYNFQFPSGLPILIYETDMDIHLMCHNSGLFTAVLMRAYNKVIKTNIQKKLFLPQNNPS